MPEEKTICFDYSHGNKLVIESPSYNDFTNYLFSSSFRIGQIKQGITIEKLERYDMFIIGNPYNSFFELEEIDAIEKYVREGGGLLIVSDSGGDYENEVNLSELTERFGFKFNPDKLFDSMNYQMKTDKPIISNFEPHTITKDVEQIVYASGCSIWIDETIEADPNISIIPVAKGGLNTYAEAFNGESWEEEDKPRVPMIVAINYYKGRVVGLGNVSIFSSLSSVYGYNAMNNNILVSNIIHWLITSKTSSDSSAELRLLSVPIIESLALWMEGLVQHRKWNKVSDIINFAIKFLKDNYDEVMERTEERRKKLMEERKRREEERKAQEQALAELGSELDTSSEDSILEKIDTRSEEEADALDDILGELAKFTDDED